MIDLRIFLSSIIHNNLKMKKSVYTCFEPVPVHLWELCVNFRLNSDKYAKCQKILHKIFKIYKV